MTAFDSVLLARVEELIGTRGVKGKRAVRFDDLAGARITGPADVLIGKAARDVVTLQQSASALQSALDTVRAELAAAEAEIAQAKIDVANAAAAAEAAEVYADAAVASARTALEMGIAEGQADTERMLAVLSSRTDGVLADQYLTASDWTRWVGQGALTRRDNDAYPVGQTWDFTTLAGQADGIQIVTSAETIWPGARGAPAYVIEVDHAGPVAGAGVVLIWRNTAGTPFEARMSFAEMGSGAAAGVAVARGFFARPAGFTGTFASHALIVAASGHDGVTAGKSFAVHRVNVRLATEAEIAQGDVIGAVMAEVQRDYLTAVQTNTAIASATQAVQAQVDDLSAEATITQTAVSGLLGTTGLVRIATGANSQSASLEVIAYDAVGGASGSAIKLNAQSVIALNTISAPLIVAGAILTDKIATGAVTAAKVAAGAITAVKADLGSFAAVSGWVETLTIADFAVTDASDFNDSSAVEGVGFSSTTAREHGRFQFYVPNNSTRLDCDIGLFVGLTGASTTSDRRFYLEIFDGGNWRGVPGCSISSAVHQSHYALMGALNVSAGTKTARVMYSMEVGLTLSRAVYRISQRKR